MAAFAIFLHPKAGRFLEKLDADPRKRIKAKLKELELPPESIGKHLRYSNFWSLRTGDYRVI